MTIQRTRELLGKKVERFTDAEIALLIQRTERATDALFELAVRKALEERNKITRKQK